VSANSDKYRTAIAGFSSVVEKVGDWSAPSPCNEWCARDIVGHVIAGLQMAAATDAGQSHGDAAADVEADPAGSFRVARDRALDALTDENLAATVQGPMGPMPLDQMLGMFLAPDALIHTWDLGKAAGIDVTLDPQLVDETYSALQPIDEMIRQPGVFGPKVEPPAGADAQTKLMCFVGRTP